MERNKEALMKLASFLREEDRWQDGDLRFDMAFWFDSWRNSCGTVCCIGGTAEYLLFGAHTARTAETEAEELTAHYGLTMDEWCELCFPDGSQHRGQHSFETTRLQAAALIEAIANGAQMKQGRWKLAH
jgi:hypothetical protein